MFNANGTINSQTAIGRVVHKGELRELSGEKATKVIDLRIACDAISGSGDSKKERQVFFGFSLFGHDAKFASDYVKIADKVFVRGQAYVEEYTKDDEKRWSLKIDVEEFTKVGDKPERKSEGGEGGGEA